MQGRFRWSSTISPPDASGRRRGRMTYRFEGVPFGSVTAYRPGRPRAGDTAMTRQGWELVMDLKFSDPGRIKSIASWLASDHGRDLFPTCFSSDVALVPAPGHAPRTKGGEPRPTTVELVRSMESEGLGKPRQWLRRQEKVPKSAWYRGDRPTEERHHATPPVAGGSGRDRGCRPRPPGRPRRGPRARAG